MANSRSGVLVSIRCGLKGAEAGSFPIEFPTKSQLVANIKTAKALGLTVPKTLLTRTNEVIE